MQTQFNPALQQSQAAAAVQQQQQQSPENLVGAEYAVVHIQEPALYVIHKRYRHSPSETEHLESLYVIDGTIYKAPTLRACLESRLAMHVHYLEEVLALVKEHAVFQPGQVMTGGASGGGYGWRVPEVNDGKSSSVAAMGKVAGAAAKNGRPLVTTVSDREFTDRVSRRLNAAVEEFAIASVTANDNT